MQNESKLSGGQSFRDVNIRAQAEADSRKEQPSTQPRRTGRSTPSSSLLINEGDGRMISFGLQEQCAWSQRVLEQWLNNTRRSQDVGNYSSEDLKRKATPVYSGFMKYFPDAMLEVARLSLHANEKHNPGEPLHWSKDKSKDHADCLIRHQLEAGVWDESNQCDHAVSVAWRAMAQLQTLIELGELAERP